MRITSKGQVTIPADIRERAGLLPNTEVDFVMEGDSVRLIRSNGENRKASRGQQLINRIRAHRGALKMTTEEIMALTRGD